MLEEAIPTLRRVDTSSAMPGSVNAGGLWLVCDLDGVGGGRCGLVEVCSRGVSCGEYWLKGSSSSYDSYNRGGSLLVGSSSRRLQVASATGETSTGLPMMTLRPSPAPVAAARWLVRPLSQLDT
jgi:hypothetical protein